MKMKMKMNIMKIKMNKNMIMKQWVRTKKNEITKNLNDLLDEIIDKSTSFEGQIELLKKQDLKGYWSYIDYDDKELKSKYFKIQLADMSNQIDEKLFEQVFGHTLIKLVNELINTTYKERKSNNS